ncbi:MAG: hypothetical protein KJ623_00955 [Nanoarchaeota archaeon]|nr:hypothetical protein [Nanoarchaeota archaeon]MBU0962600.1 hypothetical protein [Nanoarchaeota archaeon]
MRLLLSRESKKKLFNLLKDKYKVNSIQELSIKTNFQIKTLQSWFYLKDRYLPSSIIDKSWFNKLDVLDIKQDNWGLIKGGKNAYHKIIRERGIASMKRQQALGGKRAAIIKERLEEEKFRINIRNPLFLELYGILLGDGWLSNFNIKNKKVWLIGISSNLKLDREYVNYYKSTIQKLFNRNGTVRIRSENNVSEFVLSHKILLKYLNEKLRFPIGKKENLRINSSIYSLGFSKLKYVLRGIFDTDGSFYLGKNKKGIPYYPIISIHMKEPKLIKQIQEILKSKGFKVAYDKNNNMIKINGKDQLKKWLNDIGSSNPYKLNKMKDCLLSRNSNPTNIKK